MDKVNRFSFYIILASLAMGILIVMQIFWVINAYKLKSDLFDHRVNIVLKTIVNQMMDQKNQTHKNIFNVHYCMFQQQDIIEHIDAVLLDSIIVSEFESINIESNYDYAVYRKMDSLFLISNRGTSNIAIINSPYNISLTCVSSDDSFHFGLVFPDKKFYILKQILIWLFVNLFLFLLIGLSYYKIVYYFIQLKKLSAIKANFINNLTHEFKTPIATISIAGDMLKKNEVSNDEEKRNKYLNIISNENKRLKSQVDQILHIALIERQELSFNIEIVDVHTIIQESLEIYNVVISEQGVVVRLDLNATNTKIATDKIHFKNAISNLIDNAIKYAENSPVIVISTFNENNKVCLRVKDNGIGISNEHLPYIFKQFYRVPTGNVHNIKGFGLGLYYVKTVVDMMKGAIKVESKPNKGTAFTISVASTQ